MAVVQEAFDISDELIAGIASGKYKRFGGVVRYAVGPQKGQIVKHLDPIELEGIEEAKSLAKQAIQLAKDHKGATAVICLGTGVAIVGGVAYKKIRDRDPKEVIAFREALAKYLEAVRQGQLSIQEIDEMIDALEVLKSHKRYKEMTVRLSAEDLDTIVNQIHEYTLKLANDNSIDLEHEHVMEDYEPGNTMINLQKNLEAQQHIFRLVA